MFLWLQRDPVNPGNRGARISPARSRRCLGPPAVARQNCLKRGRKPSLMTIEVAGDQAWRGQPVLLGDSERGDAPGQLEARHRTARPPRRVDRGSQDGVSRDVGTDNMQSPRAGPVV